MLIYAMLLHDNSLKPLRKPLTFHIYAVLAFVAVLMTYFGVNFVLGGMHSYAG
jgi:ABC-type transport system involved in cytochrome c biogenesis permease subunit